MDAWRPCTVLTLADFGWPDGYVVRQVSCWSKQYQASRTVEMPAMDKLMA
jgi:hypothetical protein